MPEHENPYATALAWLGPLSPAFDARTWRRALVPTAGQIIGLLRQADVALAQGQSVEEICRGLGVSEANLYHWRSG